MLLAVALLSTQEAEAQFLQKLAKGLEKVNDTLDKVEDGVENIKNNPLTSNLFKKKKSTTKEEEQPTANSSVAESAENQNLTMAESVAVAASPRVFDESDYEEVEPQYPRPYIGPNTKYMILNDLYNAVMPVYEDIFAVKDGGYYSFWNVDGTKLYNAEWEYCNGDRGYGNDIPQFGSGVLAARNRKPNSTGQRVISLLYVDGSVRELDPTWKVVTTFRDGLALVTKGGGSRNEYFFIDISGKRQFPNLKDVYGGERNSMRPLRDDRRAFCRLVWATARWGFIDSKGNEVIPTQYLRVGDFSDGYAWAIKAESQFVSEGELLLINTEGEVVYRDTDIYADVTPVKNGRFFKRSDDLWTLYDITGKRLKMYSTALPFFDGYALAAPEVDGSNPLLLIDPNGTPVRQITEFDESDLDSSARFSKQGLMPIEISWGNNAYINYLGDIVMHHDHKIWSFTDCGYALVNLEDDAIGIINLEGELQWIFHTKMAEYWDRGELPIIPGPKPPINDPIPGPWPPIEVDKNGPAIGPKVVVPTRYPIRVKVEGEGRAWISPDQKDFAYGDVVMLHTEPAENWKLASVRIYGGNRTAPTEELLRVTEEREYIVKFIKKDDDLPPPFDNAYCGERVFEMDDFKMPVRIYAEMSPEADIATPYGDNTYGFIVAMFNPRERIVTEEFAANIFSAPLRISGYHFNETTGERWLVADGGSVTFGNLKITPNDGFAMLWINMIMSVNGYSSPQMTPRHYRIEMLDFDEESGEFTCGRLQTYSAEYGWLDGGDERLNKKREGFMMTKHDSGIPADFFTGAKMRKSERRTDIDWYPPLNWYDDDESILDGVMKSMQYEYGNYKSEYDQIFNE